MENIESSNELTDDQRIAILAQTLASAIVNLEKAYRGGDFQSAEEILLEIANRGDEKLTAIVTAAFREEVRSEPSGYAGYRKEIGELLNGTLSEEAAHEMQKQAHIEQIENYLRDSDDEVDAREVVLTLIEEGFCTQDEAEKHFQEIKQRINKESEDQK